MLLFKQRVILPGIASCAMFFSATAYAECGPDPQCIAVSIDPLVKPAHGTPLADSTTLSFGSQAVATISTSKPIEVGAVGPTGSTATLGAITLSNKDDFAIANSSTCTAGSTSLAQGGNTCTIEVTFNPTTPGAKSASIAVQASGYTRTINLTGTTPLVGRLDPTESSDVGGLIVAQGQTAKRFSRAQVSNFQRRMESLHRSAGADNTDAARTDTTSGAGFDSALNALASVASTRTLNLSSSNHRDGNGDGSLSDDIGIWIGGDVHFGSRNQTNSSSLRYSTDGISIGVDRRFSNTLALGLGVGFARDKTEIGSDGTNSHATGSSLTLYGSYQPTSVIYVDGLLGYGVQTFDTDRYVAVVSDFARSSRKGTQIFGSLGAGYEHNRNGLLVSPYGRLDFATERLKQASETGAGTNALTYFEQTVPMLQSSLGLRIESQHETNFGWVLPRLRLELKHDFEKNRQAKVAYTDQLIGSPLSAPRYAMTPNTTKRNALLMGFGSDFIFRKGMKLGIDYQTQRTFGSDRNQAIGVWLSKDLNDKGMPSALISSSMYADPVRVEAGYTFDDNLTRARDAANKLSDQIYSLNISKGTIFPVTDHTRALFTGFLNGEKLHTYTGLDRYSGGVQGEFQYRPSGQFDAPIFGIFGRVFYDDYYSELRTGSRYSVGINARQPLTDRIDMFGALARNVRNAKSGVFDLKDYAARFNLDYSLGQSGALYLGGEYRRGDSVTSVPASVAYSDLAEASVQDDAYPDHLLNAYRLDAKTVLWTLGYNLPLGARDSIDFSVRDARSTPTGTVAATTYYSGGSTRYTARQYSVAYLMRF